MRGEGVAQRMHGRRLDDPRADTRQTPVLLTPVLLVLRKEIPKPGGGVRELGIPTVLDRLIQQALAQVLQAEWEQSESNRGRRCRSCRDSWDEH